MEYYLYICDIYGKAVNVSSFCSFIGLSPDIIYDWSNGVNRSDKPFYSMVYKILDTERERSLSDLLISGSRPNIGLLAVLNHEKGWNLPGSTKEVKHVAAVESPEQISARYQSRLSDQKRPLLSDDSQGNNGN